MLSVTAETMRKVSLPAKIAFGLVAGLLVTGVVLVVVLTDASSGNIRGVNSFIDQNNATNTTMPTMMPTMMPTAEPSELTFSAAPTFTVTSEFPCLDFVKNMSSTTVIDDDLIDVSITNDQGVTETNQVVREDSWTQICSTMKTVLDPTNEGMSGVSMEIDFSCGFSVCI